MNGASFAPHEVRSSLIRSMSSRAPVVKAFAGREGSSTSSFSQYCFRTWSWAAHGGLGNQDLSCVCVRARVGFKFWLYNSGLRIQCPSSIKKETSF